MKAEMVAIRAEDGVMLHGAYYEGREDNPAVVLLPGAAMNFYTGLGAFLPGIKPANLPFSSWGTPTTSTIKTSANTN